MTVPRVAETPGPTCSCTCATTAPTSPKGSYLYPPILHNAAEAIVFWESVEIPDKVCDEVASQYVARWQNVTDYLPEQMWDYGIKAQREAVGKDVSEDAKAQFVGEARLRLGARQESLDPRDARVAAKVIGLVHAKQGLSAGDRRLIDEHPIETTTGFTTVYAYNVGHGLGYFALAISDPATYRRDVPGQLAQIRLLLEVVNEKMNTSQEASDDAVRLVGTHLVDMIYAVAHNH